MLLTNALVLHGHLPTGKRNEPGPGSHVTIVEWSAAKGVRGGGQARRP
jgi:hypothetical protein